MALCLIIVMFSTKALAFSSSGHQLICHIAYQNLAPSQQLNLNEFIETISKSQIKVINKWLKRSRSHKIEFADLCVWADAIKNYKRYARYKSWHFINVPRNAQQVLNSHCDDDCITYAIKFHLSQFTNNKLKVNQRLQALMFLSHWLGDMHQPLHVSFQSDLGGNLLPVSSKLYPSKNLHQVWDRDLLVYLQQQPFKIITEQSDFSKHQHPTTDIINETNVLAWATQSLTVARGEHVQYCKMSETGYCAKNPKTIIINEDYLQQNSLILKPQILDASKRLTIFLKQHF